MCPLSVSIEYSNIYCIEWSSFSIIFFLLLLEFVLLASRHVSVLAASNARSRMDLGVLNNVLNFHGPVSVRQEQPRKSVLRWQSMLIGINASVALHLV